MAEPPTATLALVSAPHHILYAVEACHRYELPDLSLLVIARSPANAAMIDEVAAYFELPVVSTLRVFSAFKRKIPTLFELLHALRNGMTRWRAQTVLLADYGSAIAANMHCDRLIVLGDGTKQIVIGNADPLFTGKFGRQRGAERLLRPLGLRLRPRSDLLFSPFVEDGPGLAKNRLDWHRQRYERLPVQDEQRVYFLGAYFSENERLCAMDDAAYLDLLRGIRDGYRERGLEFVYVPHRQEGAAKLAALAAAGFVIDAFEYPAELEFLLRETAPRYLASFYSSCLYHFSLMSPACEVVAYKPDLSLFHPDYVASVAQVYDWYQGRLQVVEV